MARLITFTKKGIYCPKADVYIDPWKPVPNALITHAHADHARPGHKHYLCHKNTEAVLKYRLGKVNVQTIEFEKIIDINGVKISFHPAGHIIGSAQIKLQDNQESWVISGDYKLEDDHISTPFEPVKCDYFITESTFGLPVFKWEKDEFVFNKINDWWSNNVRNKRPSIISAYSLGKAQRIIQNVNHDIGPVYTHGAVENTNKVLRSAGINIKDTQLVDFNKIKDFSNALIIAPPAAIDSTWSKKIKNASKASASGWMALRGTKRRRNIETGFVLSDHADWEGLNSAIKATGAHTVIVTHGYNEVFSKWLNEIGISSKSIETAFEGEQEESNL